MATVSEFLLNQEIALPIIEPLPFSKWHIVHPVVDLSQHKNISKSDQSVLCKIISLEFINNWYSYLYGYTDGSKDDEYCTAAFYIPNKYQCGKRLDDFCNNFYAELVVILKALTWVYDKQIKWTVMFSDSLSAIQIILKVTKRQWFKYTKRNILSIVSDRKKWYRNGICINSQSCRDSLKWNGKKIAKDSYDKDGYQEVQLARLRFGVCWLNITKAIFDKEKSDLCLVKENVDYYSY